jgi:gliding motility-associated-like protein
MADAIFQWMGPGNYTSSATQGTIPSVSAANAGIYVLTVTSPAGCLTRDTATVIIKPLPSAAITGNTPCRLQTLQLDNNNTLSGSSYLWTNRNGFTSSQQNVSISPYNYADTGFYYLTVSTNGCLAKDSIDAGLRDIPAIRFIINGGICVNTESTQLDAADTSGLEGAGIFSGPGVSSAGVFIPSAAGVGASVIRYTYTGTDGCSGYKEQAISVYPVPVVTTLPGVSIWAGGSVLLNTTVTGNISSVTWSPTTGLNDPDILSPLATPLVSTHYIITVTSDSGCVVQDTTVIKVLKGITIPNAFSPNGDGINDKWMIDNLSGFAESTVDIFDRYGKKVFSSKGYTTPWDGNYNGKPLPVATYYYVITISDGYHRQTYSGWVVLLR